MTEITIKVGTKLFTFHDFNHWVNRASSIWKMYQVAVSNTVCVDQKGRICTNGKHFMLARDEAAFPVYVYAVEAEEPPNETPGSLG